MPVLDADGRIEARQVGRDEGDPRYKWFASAGYERGASAGAPVNFANAHLFADAREITVTEGALKSQIVAYLTQSPVVGLPGVYCPSGFMTQLRQAAPSLLTVYAAFDRDSLSKPQVYEALMRFVDQLEAARSRVRIRTWPGQAKGFDDYLLATRLSQREVAAL